MTPADLQIPPRESAPVVDDPAITAGKKAEDAKAAWLAAPHATREDEETPEFKAAEKLLLKMEHNFADAPVASLAGARVKMRALLKDLVEDDAAHYATAHVETVLAFMEGFAGEAQAEPLVELWTERNRLVARFNAVDTDPGIDALGDELSAVERRIANTEARTLAGVVVQIKLRESVLGHDHWVFSAALTRNVVTALERMGGGVVAEPDPAVVALAEFKVAKAADDAISNKDAEAETPEYQATSDRYYAAVDVVFAAVPTSMAGMAAKIRFIFDYQERGNDLWPAFDEMAKSMLPFLNGAPAPAPKPDPVVVLFEKWAVIRDEATAHSDALDALDDDAPTGTKGEINTLMEAAWARTDALEDQIMAIPATTMRGVAIKIRLASHYIFEAGDFDKRYATPARDIAYEEVRSGGLDASESYTISALRDAERLAGVTKPDPDPVVTMSVEWGGIYDEMTALSAANPDNESGENMDRWEAALERVRALEDRIIETPATSIAGVAIKLRIATDWSGGSPNLSALHATPAREIDYEKVCIVVEWTSKPVISALIDAEQLAGVS